MQDRLNRLKNRYELYLKCEEEILAGAQSYSIGKRNITRADLNEISETIKYLEKEIATEEAKLNKKGKNAVIGIIPRDI